MTTTETMTRIIATYAGKSFTGGQLDAAWILIAPKDHWKDPVKATIHAEDVRACCAACEFFTGTALRVMGYAQRDEGIFLDVEAIGYAAGPCGD